MKTYKALFTLPDDIVPPAVIGFQVAMPVETPQGMQIQGKNFTAPLMPIESIIEDCEDFTEVNEDEDD